MKLRQAAYNRPPAARALLTVALTTHTLVGMCSQRVAKPTAPASLTVVAESTGVNSYTLHRLCRSGKVRYEIGCRGWLVRPRDVEQYVDTRRASMPITIGLTLQGGAPKGNHDSGSGWLFQALRDDGTQTTVHIWFSHELIGLLQTDSRDVEEIVQSAAANCLADALLVEEDLPDGFELLYGVPDRAFVTRAAGTDS